MKINVLGAEVYNRIAAGEVIDRPYSVVKELVENAIDAGATEISVDVEGGGKRLIRVTDNGCGIEKDDLENAYRPHATSKLKAAEDLFSVQTLGFRGEAIASIASVSKMRIVSDAGEGAFSLGSEGGKMGTVLPAAGAKGTETTVRDLFFNTPARLKFLKSDGQEEADVTSMMARFILSRPDISFVYTANGAVKYRSFGDGLPAALATVYGGDVLSRCFEIDAEKHGVRLRGFLGDQNFSKPNRGYQSLFVNGRYIVNQTVSAAIANAYSSYLMKRQYPFYVLFLDVPPEIVDVNVHPNKADVRFSDNQVIYGCVYSVVSAVLDGNSRALEYLVGAEKKDEGNGEPAAEVAPPAAPPAPAMSYEAAKKELAFDVSPYGGGSVSRTPVTPPRTSYAVNAPVEAPKTDYFEENRRWLRESAQPKQEKVDVASLEYKGELFRTYLLYEVGDRVYLVDQHAAHERLLYDKLRERTERRSAVSQPMLAPYLLNVNAQEFRFLRENFDRLKELGFEIEEFGGTSVKVSAVPAELTSIDLHAFFDEILSSMESLRAIRLSDLLKDKLASAACKAAVKGGEKLTDEEARSLIERAQGDMGLRCPHGRPVAVKMEKSELEKLFKRIV